MRQLLQRYFWLGVGFLALFTTTRLSSLTGWDDAFYVAQLTSAIADRDLLLQDDLLAFPRPLDERLRSVTTVLESGALHNTFSVGFAVVHGTYAWPFVAFLEQKVGPGLRRLLAVGSLVLLILTALSMVHLCELWGFAPTVARLASGLALASSPLALFGTRVYLNSHLLSALFATVVLIGFILMMERGHMSDALLTGLAAGLLTINRWQDVLLLACFVPALIVVLRSSKPTDLRRPTPAVIVAAAMSFAAVALLQLLAWRAQFSSWFLVPQGAGYMQWTSPAVLPLLVSPYQGLIPWAPGLATGVFLVPFLTITGERGITRLVRRGFLIALPIFFYFSAAPRDWWGGDSYGPRRLATLVPIGALGMAALLQRLRPAIRMAVSAILLLWASLTVSAYISGFDDLWVLWSGRPGPFNRHPASVYQGVHWIDSLGPFHALKPGFSFSDRPHVVDRLLGALTCAALVVVVTWCWSALRRVKRAQLVLLGFALVWVFVCAVWLGTAVPTNDDWNRRWAAVINGNPEPNEGRPFPPGGKDAVHLLRAVQALKARDETAFEEHWRMLRIRGAFGIDEREVRALVASTR